MSSKDGKKFESSVEDSCKNQNVFLFRVRDVFLPPDVRKRVKVPKNKYDFLFFHNYRLFPTELKSTKAKSFSFEGNNPKIKPHQIKALTEDNEFEGLICGLLLNFREPNNKTYFVHIDDFNHYVKAANGEIEHTYEGRLNKKSIPLHIVEQIGVEVKGVKKRTRYTYMIKKTLEELIKKYG